MSTILVNANIYVERGNFQEAMLIENGIIKAVGTNAEIRAMAPAGCEEIDAEGRTVIPGFNDSHQHLYNVGERRSHASTRRRRRVQPLTQRTWNS